MPSIAAALSELLNDQDLSVEAVLSRHFTEDYRQSTNGEWIDRAGFAQQITQLRAGIAHVEVTVRNELVQGGAYAERHVIHVTQRDGGTAAQEVYLFGELGDDGRFRLLEELVRPLAAG